MKVAIEEGTVRLSPEDESDRTLGVALRNLRNHVFALDPDGARGVGFTAIGLREEVCGDPINITRSVDPRYASISNLAATPFLLDEEIYGSAEAFWQSLKFTDEQTRRRVATLSGVEAKKAGDRAPPAEVSFLYRGEMIVRGTWAHWQLMERACDAKFDQDDGARRALLGTGERPLTHRVPKDSKTIPGVIMADIWMRIRARLRSR